MVDPEGFHKGQWSPYRHNPLSTHPLQLFAARHDVPPLCCVLPTADSIVGFRGCRGEKAPNPLRSGDHSRGGGRMDDGGGKFDHGVCTRSRLSPPPFKALTGRWSRETEAPSRGRGQC
ncbi:hypothetical protein M752DRAFT_51872 [Aspergillus phoenicis ATCC 13157]|uniref:Contig An15c0190, genomic contig n=4 Tax=Aspergillus TaxID=5052 RepID=A2R5U2_ASPNC|nr:uncharacterized protein An15g05560 [Aspergillus niger]RDH22280.1 hypothetical protein M747DRAFT_13178 [Aspergillus niger ATCC 13496]RDK39737.1 hypothetical protein M752DRAFT_51872 [Aspergillus phoenicis ATCC 13157]CAK97341.1 unnamed protein product [Aspergillus niger]